MKGVECVLARPGGWGSVNHTYKGDTGLAKHIKLHVKLFIDTSMK